MRVHKTVHKTMWVAVRVQRGFVSEVRAYADERSARRRERWWRQEMNPDYDETAVSPVRLSSPRRRVRQRTAMRKRRTEAGDRGCGRDADSEL